MASLTIPGPDRSRPAFVSLLGQYSRPNCSEESSAPGRHRLLVEPRVRFGWAVANQHKVLGARGKARAYWQRWVGSVRRSDRLRWTENQPTAGQQTRRRGSECLQPPRCSRIRSGNPTGSGSARVWVRLARASTASVWGPRALTTRRRGRWMSEPGDGGTSGPLTGSGARRSEHLGQVGKCSPAAGACPPSVAWPPAGPLRL